MQHNDSFYEFSPMNERTRTRFNPPPAKLMMSAFYAMPNVVDTTYKNQCIYVVAQSAQNVILSDTVCDSAGLCAICIVPSLLSFRGRLDV